MDIDLKQKAIDLEAFETDPWVADAVLRHEILTRNVLDPCVGTGILARAAAKAGYKVQTWDVFDWSGHIEGAPSPDHVRDFLAAGLPRPFAGEFSVFMNSPFSTACEFVDAALALGARKIVAFQRWSWRESKGRRQWWAKNPPSRMYVCGDRATCWRFDIPETCVGEERCFKMRSKDGGPSTYWPLPEQPAIKCRECMAGTSTSHGFFVWEHGHKGAEICHDLWKL